MLMGLFVAKRTGLGGTGRAGFEGGTFRASSANLGPNSIRRHITIADHLKTAKPSAIVVRSPARFCELLPDCFTRITTDIRREIGWERAEDQQ